MSKIIQTKICPTCGKEFKKPANRSIKSWLGAKFCSRKCRRNSQETKELLRKINTGRPFKPYSSKEVICAICGKKFRVWNSLLAAGKGKCCSKKCAAELMKKDSYFITRGEKQKRLDIEKARKSNSGANNYWWKGGITSLRDKIYRSDIFRNWRREVFKRDNWTCQECGTVCGELQAHHIKPFSDILKENNIKTLEDALKCKELGDINNGITLCKECHKLTDSYGWKNQFRNK